MLSITWTGNSFLRSWSLLCRSYKWTYVFCSSRYFGLESYNNISFSKWSSSVSNPDSQLLSWIFTGYSLIFLVFVLIKVSIFFVLVRIVFLLIWWIRVLEVQEAPAPESIRTQHLTPSISMSKSHWNRRSKLSKSLRVCYRITNGSKQSGCCFVTDWRWC